MTNGQIEIEIKQAISNISGIAPEEIRNDALFVEDLGMDSLSIIEALVEMERTFKLDVIPEEVESQIRCVNDGVRFVVQNQKEQLQTVAS